MALPSSGVIKFSDINVELGVAANTTRKLSDSAVRTLFGVASGRITLSNGRGKANSFTFNKTISSNTQNYNLRSDAVAAGWDGVVALNATVTVNAGIYVWSDSTATAGFATGSIPVGSTVNITNNGFIIGKGGGQGAVDGGPAMNISYPVTITNNSYIAGGGGAGASDQGGGGAGGGVGRSPSGTNGGAGGGLGQNGSNGTGTQAGVGGGGGGRFLPGIGGAQVSATNVGRGGAAGGSGSAWAVQSGSLWTSVGGGGGGGWGASGGTSSGGIAGNPGATSGAGGSSNNNGGNGTSASGAAGPAQGTGGKAVNLNGNSVTWLANGTRWGAIS